MPLRLPLSGLAAYGRLELITTFVWHLDQRVSSGLRGVASRLKNQLALAT